MGSCGAAIGGNGFAYYNPATPALDRKTNLNIGYAPMPFDFTIAHAQGTWSLDNMFFGANITNHFVDGIIPAGIEGTNPATPFSYDGSMASVNFGVIVNNFGFGITLNGLEERIASSTAYGLSVSAGLTYAINNKLNFGLSALQLGATTGYDETSANLGQGYALPRSGRMGLAFSDSIFHMGYAVTGDMVYRDVGVKGESLSNRINRVSVPVGIEFWPTSFAAIRLGKRFNFDTELFTVGAGLSLSVLTCDIAVAVAKYVDDYEARPFIDLTYTLQKQPVVASARAAAKAIAAQPVIISKPAETKTDSLKDTITQKAPIAIKDSLVIIQKPDTLGPKVDSTLHVPQSSPQGVDTIGHTENGTSNHDVAAPAAQPANSNATDPKLVPKKQ